MGIYDTTRQYYLGQLHQQHHQQAATLADDYRTQIAELDNYWRSLHAYGGTPGAADRATYEATRHAYYDQYVERFYQLQADIEQQAAALNADYDTRDREYEAAFAALSTNAAQPGDYLAQRAEQADDYWTERAEQSESYWSRVASWLQ